MYPDSFGVGGLFGLILGIIFAAIVLMIVSNLKVGLKVDNFKGALVGAIAIGVVNYVLMWLLGLFM